MPLSKCVPQCFGDYVVLGVDPAFEHSCRTAVLDSNGILSRTKNSSIGDLMTRRVYELKLTCVGIKGMPASECAFRENRDLLQLLNFIYDLNKKLDVVVVIGGGMASRETEYAVGRLIDGFAFDGRFACYWSELFLCLYRDFSVLLMKPAPQSIRKIGLLKRN